MGLVWGIEGDGDLVESAVGGRSAATPARGVGVGMIDRQPMIGTRGWVDGTLVGMSRGIGMDGLKVGMVIAGAVTTLASGLVGSSLGGGGGRLRGWFGV